MSQPRKAQWASPDVLARLNVRQAQQPPRRRSPSVRSTSRYGRRPAKVCGFTSAPPRFGLPPESSAAKVSRRGSALRCAFKRLENRSSLLPNSAQTDWYVGGTRAATGLGGSPAARAHLHGSVATQLATPRAPAIALGSSKGPNPGTSDLILLPPPFASSRMMAPNCAVSPANEPLVGPLTPAGPSLLPFVVRSRPRGPHKS